MLTAPEVRATWAGKGIFVKRMLLESENDWEMFLVTGEIDSEYQEHTETSYIHLMYSSSFH